MTSSPLQISILPQTKRGKKTNKNKLLLPMLSSTESKVKNKAKNSPLNFAQLLLHSQPIQTKTTKKQIPQKKQNIRNTSTIQNLHLSQKQLFTQNKIKLQNKHAIPLQQQNQNNLQSMLLEQNSKAHQSFKTFKDIQQIAQDHRLNLTRLEISNNQTLVDHKKQPLKISRNLAQNQREQSLSRISEQTKLDQNQIQTQSRIKMHARQESSPIKQLLNQKTTQNNKNLATTTSISSPISHIPQINQEEQPILNNNISPQTISSKTSSLSELISQNNPLKEKDKIEEKRSEKYQDIPLSENKKDIQFKIAQSKETITHFSQKLKEEIANYKPPFTKLSMELNPQELGKLEVTITKKGKELQIQINANNPNALQTFIQNQSEFRNTLANVGFNNIELSFSQGDSQKQKSKQGKQNQKGNENGLEILKDAPLVASMEIKMVQYA